MYSAWTRIFDMAARPARLAGSIALAAIAVGCATPAMDAQWRDPQAAPLSMQGRALLVVCRGADLTLERICEDRLAEQAVGLGATVKRIEPAPADASRSDEALLTAARASGAGAVLATMLEPVGGGTGPSGGSIGIGVGGGSGGWGSRTSAGVGITLPIGGAAGPGLAASTRLLDAASGRLLWSGRARSPGAAGQAEQVPELLRVTAEALRSSGLF